MESTGGSKKSFGSGTAIYVPQSDLVRSIEPIENLNRISNPSQNRLRLSDFEDK